MKAGKQVQLKSYQLVLLVLAIGLLSRLLVSMGAPPVVNFLHFAFVPLAVGMTFPRMQPYTSKLLGATLALLGVIVFSALVNGSGIVNVVLDFLLVAEPFLFLSIMAGIYWSEESLNRFHLWLLLFTFANACFAYHQYFVQGLVADDVRGIFLATNGGAHLCGAVALSAAVYFLAYFSGWKRVLGVAVALLYIPIVWFSDSKQVLLAFLISLLILILLKLLSFSDPAKTSGYLIAAVASAAMVFVMSNTIFPALEGGADTERTEDGLELKLSVIPMIEEHYTSPLNTLVGLGPGHTVGRLGQMLPDYAPYLQPLGATTSPVTEKVQQANQADEQTNNTKGSSLWSRSFSWAGLWGDLGLLGLGVYIYTWFLVWRRFCLGDLSRFFLISILVLGFMYIWIEEPSYMLFVVTLIGLQWQDIRNKEWVAYQRRLREHLHTGPYSGNAPTRVGSAG